MCTKAEQIAISALQTAKNKPELPNAQQNFEIGNQEKILPKLNFIVQETLNVLNPLPDLKGKYHEKDIFTNFRLRVHSSLYTLNC